MGEMSAVRRYSLKELVEAEKVKVYGRCILLENEALSCDFSASGIEFNAYCSGNVTVDVKVIAPTYGTEPEKSFGCYYTVWVDGIRNDVRRSEEDPRENGLRIDGEGTLVLAEDLPEGWHTFKILKQSNVLRCITELQAVSLTGEFGRRPADSRLLIEFIGDSLTCGTGNLARPDWGDVSINYEESTSGFAYMTADELGADWNIVARPGIGVVFASVNKNNMSEIYHLQCFWRSNKTEQKVGRIPDLVVIYLGTNDNRQLKRGPESAPIFDKAFRHLVDTVISNYGKETPILLLKSRSLTETAKAVIRGIASDYENVNFIPFTHHEGGGEGHPDLAEHRMEADELIAALKERYPALFPAE
ncbi:MAG: hypothetical protein E7443_02410 [Ruminococcaceae bacterium]|nr:hypothetical protein [Oscillospiraceae bacterium]